MSTDANKTSGWWGSFKIDSGQSKQWRIGPLTLIVHRLNGDWRVGHQREENFDITNVTWEITDTALLPENLENNSRYILQDSTGILIITPRLADRPVIIRPHMPFNLAAGEKVTLYISSPLWMALSVGDSEKTLDEFAIQRPSDTWFGPSTLEGELCYASTTHCRLYLEELPQRAHRAITPVVINNLADTALSVERINLPAPLLQLYSSKNNQLWTPNISLVREKDGDMAALNIDKNPPKEAEDALQLSEARTSMDNGVLFRAFNAIFN